MNGVELACCGTKALKSAFMVKFAGCMFICVIVGTNGFIVALPWKLLWADTGLNWGAKTLVEAQELNVWSVSMVCYFSFKMKLIS